jgi:S-adenosylmethionine decarboxylase
MKSRESSRKTGHLVSHHLSSVIPTSPLFDGSAEKLITLLRASAIAVGLTPVGDVTAQFEPGGASAVVLLAESHVAAHYWPEISRLTVDIHVCDYRRDNSVRARELARYVEQQASNVTVHWSHHVASDQTGPHDERRQR